MVISWTNMHKWNRQIKYWRALVLNINITLCFWFQKISPIRVSMLIFFFIRAQQRLLTSDAINKWFDFLSYDLNWNCCRRVFKNEQIYWRKALFSAEICCFVIFSVSEILSRGNWHISAYEYKFQFLTSCYSMHIKV